MVFFSYEKSPCGYNEIASTKSLFKEVLFGGLPLSRKRLFQKIKGKNSKKGVKAAKKGSKKDVKAVKKKVKRVLSLLKKKVKKVLRLLKIKIKRVLRLLKKKIKRVLRLLKKKVKNQMKNWRKLFEILKKNVLPPLYFFLGWNYSFIFSCVAPFLKSLPSTCDSWLKGNGIAVDLVNPTIWGVPWMAVLLIPLLLMGFSWISVYLCREVLILLFWLFCVCRLVLAHLLSGLQWVYAAFLKWWGSL